MNYPVLAYQLSGTVIQVSVVQGREPQHFIKMFGGKMMVCNNEVVTQPLNKTDCFLVKFGNVYAYMPDSGQSCIILTSKVTFNIMVIRVVEFSSGGLQNWKYFCLKIKIHPSLLIDLKSKGHFHRYKLHQIF